MTLPASALDWSLPATVLTPTPYTIVIDTREGLPYTFARPFRGYCGSLSRSKLLSVQTTVAHLDSGDYSLAGYETVVAVERKSVSDFLSTLTAGRARFTRELERLNKYEFSAVVVEAEWSQILAAAVAGSRYQGTAGTRSRMSPKSVLATVMAWDQRFKTRWWFVPGREVAEAVTLKILDRFWREKNR